MNLKQELKVLIEDVAEGRTTVRKAVAFILNEMGRGGRILVVDENLRDLDDELAKLNYTVQPVITEDPDQKIKKSLGGKVFITHNGDDFKDKAERHKWRYGLIWIKVNPPAKDLAKRVEEALVKANFSNNLLQLVTITTNHTKYEV